MTFSISQSRSAPLNETQNSDSSLSSASYESSILLSSGSDSIEIITNSPIIEIFYEEDSTEDGEIIYSDESESKEEHKKRKKREVVTDVGRNKRALIFR